MATKTKYQGFDNFVSEKENIINLKKRASERTEQFSIPIKTDMQKDDKKDNAAPTMDQKFSQSVIVPSTDQLEVCEVDDDIPDFLRNENIELGRNTIDHHQREEFYNMDYQQNK